MKPDDCKRLRKLFVRLLSNLDAGDVTDYLQQEGVLTLGHIQRINHKVTTKGKMRQLLYTLRTKTDDNAFDIFCSSLIECGKGYLATELQEVDIVDVLDVPVDVLDYNRTELEQTLISQTIEMHKLKEQYQSEKKEKEGLQQRLLNSEQTLNDQIDSSSFTDPVIKKYVKEYCMLPDDLLVGLQPPPPRIGTNVQAWPLMTTEEEAAYLGKYIVHYILVRRGVCKPDMHLLPVRPSAITMRKMVDKLFQHGWLQRLRSQPSTAETFDDLICMLDPQELKGYSTFQVICDELCGPSADDCNWGRIVSWYAFWSHFSGYLPIERVSDTINIFGNFIGFFIAQKISVWIESNGGWEGFSAYYSKQIEDEAMPGIGGQILFNFLRTLYS